jgi:hypothetical protein
MYIGQTAKSSQRRPRTEGLSITPAIYNRVASRSMRYDRLSADRRQGLDMWDVGNADLLVAVVGGKCKWSVFRGHMMAA